MKAATPRCEHLSRTDEGEDRVYFYARWKGAARATGVGDRADLLYYLRVEAGSPEDRPLHHVDVSAALYMDGLTG